MKREVEVLGQLRLPGVERSVRRVRGFVRETLGPDHPALEDVVTCASEAVTNAIMHTDSGQGGGMVAVTLLRDGPELVLEVSDEGAGGARPGFRDDPEGIHGRGMLIITALALKWTVRPDGDRTTVSMRFARHTPGGNPASWE